MREYMREARAAKRAALGATCGDTAAQAIDISEVPEGKADI